MGTAIYETTSLHDAPAGTHYAGTDDAADERDRREAEHIARHHAHMVAELDALSAAVHDAPADEIAAARQALDRFFAEALLPHAAGEERTTYRAAAGLDEGRLLVDSLVREHLLIRSWVETFAAATDADARVWGPAIAQLFRSHQAKEDEVVTPLLLATPGISLAEVHGGH